MSKFVLQNWWRYLIGGLSLIGSTVVDILVPLITMQIVDEVIVGRNMDMLKVCMIELMMAAIGRAIFQYVKEYLCDMAGCNVAENMRKSLLGHIFKQSKSFFDKNNTGELMARVKDDAGRIWDMTGFVGMLMTEAVLYFIGVIICMVRLNWQLSLITIAFLPFLAWGVLRLGKHLDSTYDQISEENATLTRIIEENISGVRTVKAFSAEDRELDTFDIHNKKYNELHIDQGLEMAKAEPLLHMIPRVMQIAVITVGGFWAIDGRITYGLLIAFMQYAANIVWPIENMGWMLSLISAGVAGWKKIHKIFDSEPEIKDPVEDSSNAGKEKKQTKKNDSSVINPDNTNNEKSVCFEGENFDNAVSKDGVLAFNNVSFSMNGNEILKNISFELPKGHTLGIMGATGSGKSTMVNLMERFYDVDEGSITLNGIDIRNMKLSELRNELSVVTQDVFLFSDTISENVKLGEKSLMDEEHVREAVNKAQAKNFVENLTGGYESVIGERGIGLSGGQKQRLTIARALAHERGILVLDDSTSALDMETEGRIQQVMQEHTDISKIIIAHRISSVKDADEIIVLDNGRIAERGTHAELIEDRGLYFSTYEAQYGNYRTALSTMKGGAF